MVSSHSKSLGGYSSPRLRARLAIESLGKNGYYKGIDHLGPAGCGCWGICWLPSRVSLPTDVEMSLYLESSNVIMFAAVFRKGTNVCRFDGTIDIQWQTHDNMPKKTSFQSTMNETMVGKSRLLVGKTCLSVDYSTKSRKAPVAFWHLWHLCPTRQNTYIHRRGIYT